MKVNLFSQPFYDEFPTNLEGYEMKISPEMAAGTINHEAQEHQEIEKRVGVPITWIGDGVIRIRPYPEISNGRLLTMETIWAYTYKGIGKFAYAEGTPLEEEYVRARSQMSEDPWELKSRELGKLRCAVIEMDNPSDYTPMNTPLVLCGGHPFIKEWRRFVSNLQPQTLMQIFDAEEVAPLIEISYKRGTKGTMTLCEMKISNKQAPAPELPAEFPSVTTCYVTRESQPSTEQLRKIKAYVSKQILGSVRVVNPSTPSTASPVAPPTTVSSDAVAAAFGEAPAAAPAGNVQGSEEAACNDESVKSEYPELKYGHHPAEPHPICTMCMAESGCIAATA